MASGEASDWWSSNWGWVVLVAVVGWLWLQNEKDDATDYSRNGDVIYEDDNPYDDGPGVGDYSPTYSPSYSNGYSGGYDLDCDDVSGPIIVTGSDAHGFDRDGDGIGCE